MGVPESLDRGPGWCWMWRMLDKLTGEILFPKVEGVNVFDFTLDVTWQTEAPEGFFGQDGSSHSDAFCFYFDEFVPGH